MADLLSHVLIAYAVLTVAGWYIEDLDRPWVVVGMGGAVIPDLVKINLLFDASTIEGVLGVPFSYAPVSSVGGVVVLAGVIALLFDSHYRQRAYIALVAGGFLSLLVDGMRVYADGFSNFWLYPLWIRPPTPGLFVSADPVVLGVSILGGAAVFVIDRHGAIM